MNHTIAILLDVDPGKTLGGSTERDVINITNYIEKHKLVKEVYIFSNHLKSKLNPFSKEKKSRHFVIFGRTIEQQIKTILDRHKLQMDSVFVYISGHGYQTLSRERDEKDNRDEYVRTGKQMIIDNLFWKMFIKDMDPSISFLGICDTCHSGSMFDLDFEWNDSSKTWISSSNRKPVYKKAFSLGACMDSQLENCDIGNTCGFGGALTVQLLDQNLIKDLFMFTKLDLIYVWKKISKKLRVFRQQPVIQTNFIKLS